MINLGYYKLLPLIFLIMLLSYMGNFVSNLLPENYATATAILSSTLFITLGIKLLDNETWKCPIMKWYGKIMSKAPNLNGEYKGYINYTRNGTDESKGCTIKIIQTLSTISIQSNFYKLNEEGTESENVMEEIYVDNKGVVKVYFYYHNKGCNKTASPLNQHNGFCELTFNEKEKSLNGFYFTNRKPQTMGQISVKQNT